MASDDSLLPWDDREILYFAEKLCVLKTIYFLHGFCLQTQTKTKPKK